MDIKANSYNFETLKKIDQADGKLDNSINKSGIEKSLSNEPNILESFTPEDKAKITSVLTGSSQDTIDLVIDSDSESTISMVNLMRSSLKMPELTQEQEISIQGLDEDHLQMFDFALEELNSLQLEKTNPADYMINIMQEAANISENDSKKFVELTGHTFAEPGNMAGREYLGGGNHIMGDVLEIMQREIINPINRFDDVSYPDKKGSSVESGFNPAAIDDLTENSTVTHHFGEFFRVGFNSSKMTGEMAAHHIDNTDDNAGDVRSAYFGVMLGNALKEGGISPQEAVDLTDWAYRNSEGEVSNAPWPSNFDISKRVTEATLGGIVVTEGLEYVQKQSYKGAKSLKKADIIGASTVSGISNSAGLTNNSIRAIDGAIFAQFPDISTWVSSYNLSNENQIGQ